LEQLECRRLLYAADLFATDNYDPKQIVVGDLAGGVQAIEVPAGLSVAEALAQYAGDPSVAFAEPDYLVQAAVIPSDTSFGVQYALNNVGQSVGGVTGFVDADIDAPEAWDVTTGGTAITVGVIDSGIDYRHQDLYLNIWINQDEIPAAIRANLSDTDADGLITFYDLNQPVNQGAGKITDLNANGRIDGGDLLNNASGWEDGLDQDPYLAGVTTVSRIDDLVGWDFANGDNDPLDDNNHGTHVAGTIGAIGNNALGVAGVLWKTQLAALKFLSASGSGATSGATAAVYYAIGNGIEISNNSWGGGGFSQSLANALSAASAVGHIFVAAAGNSGANNDVTASYPSNYNLPNVVAVAATNNRDGRASFSNFGATTVDLGAPGVSIRSTIPGGGYASYSGTSMATPHVAGAAALVLSAHPEWTAAQVIDSLLDTADPVAALAGRTVTGGRLNLNDAVRLDLGEPPPPPADTTGPRVVSALASGAASASSVRLTFSEAIDPASFDAFDITGFIGPAGSVAVLGVAPVIGSAGTQFDVTFATQSTPGVYSYSVGPQILDASGNAMDQNGDGTPGQPGDTYQGSFTLTTALTFTNNTRYAIRDRSSTYSYLSVNQNLRIADLNVRLDITHTYDSDLVIELRHPDGTTVLLVNRRGGSGNNFTNTVLDDEAALPVAAGVAPFAGTYRPDGSLAALDGKIAQGTWRLRVYDAAYQDIGTLNSWSLIVTPAATMTAAGGGADDFRVRALAVGDAPLAEFLGGWVHQRRGPDSVGGIDISPEERSSFFAHLVRHAEAPSTSPAALTVSGGVSVDPVDSAAADALCEELASDSSSVDGLPRLARWLESRGL
jgi:subtilisin family serine protease/subtilisin-like proprotein convertase family protein